MTGTLRAGLMLGGGLLLFAVAGPWLAPDPLAQPDLVAGTLQAPSATHWFGTDQYSRDVFARLAAGARASLGIAVAAVLVATLLGTAIGLAAGGARGATGEALRRGIDLVLGLPRLVVLLVLLAATGPLTPISLALVLGATGWPAIARLVRGETLRLREAGFVEAAHALGAPPSRILWREILPGAMAPALVAATLGVADAILLEAGLSFIGLGIQPPAPTWGGMILEARDQIARAPWLLLAPGLALVVATTAATLLGDALRQRFLPGAR